MESLIFVRFSSLVIFIFNSAWKHRSQVIIVVIMAMMANNIHVCVYL